VEIPLGYDDLVGGLDVKHGGRVEVRIVGWVLLVDWRDGTMDEARAAVKEALSARGIAEAPPDAVRIDYGSYRGPGQPSSPYVRAWVKEELLGGPAPQFSAYVPRYARGGGRHLLASPSHHQPGGTPRLPRIGWGYIGGSGAPACRWRRR
jgi:hypothetical protein